jgi:translation initiation factor 2 subunit 1
MATKKPEWPEAGDLVLASVQRITDFGAYVTLDEYGKEGLLHVSEVSSGWVRNIRDFVREGQKTVLKVLRVNAEKRHIDLSLRRVSGRERREKLLSWKHDRKADSILRSVAEKLKMSPEEVYEKTQTILEEKFGGIYEALEKAIREDSGLLEKEGLPKDLATTLTEVAREKIKMPTVTVKGILELQCLKPKGVNHIRDALLSAQNIEVSETVKTHVYVIAAPKYAIQVEAEDYKEAEKILQQASDKAIDLITKAGGTGAFQRAK